MQDTPIQAMDKQTMTKCYTQTSDAIEKNIYVYNFEEKKLSRRYNKRTNQNENEKKKWTWEAATGTLAWAWVFCETASDLGTNFRA